MYRGYISDIDSGANENYYLYINVFYAAISPNHVSKDTHYRIINVNINGHVGGSNVDNGNCGVL